LPQQEQQINSYYTGQT